MEISKTILLYAKKWARACLKMLSTKCLQIIFDVYVYKDYLALNNPEWVQYVHGVCHEYNLSSVHVMICIRDHLL